jgi:hypothetical protein
MLLFSTGSLSTPAIPLNSGFDTVTASNNWLAAESWRLKAFPQGVYRAFFTNDNGR